LIHIVGGLRLPKVLKNMTNMFFEYNILSRTFVLRSIISSWI
jgi:hypothetical protein